MKKNDIAVAFCFFFFSSVVWVPDLHVLAMNLLAIIIMMQVVFLLFSHTSAKRSQIEWEGKVSLFSV
jgi:hypothetical protein